MLYNHEMKGRRMLIKEKNKVVCFNIKTASFSLMHDRVNNAVMMSSQQHQQQQTHNKFDTHHSKACYCLRSERVKKKKLHHV